MNKSAKPTPKISNRRWWQLGFLIALNPFIYRLFNATGAAASAASSRTRYMCAPILNCHNCPARPPKSEELAQMAGLNEATAKLGLKILLEQGKLFQISEKFAMHAEVVSRARDVLVSYLRENGQLISAEYKNLIDSERKFAISLLDYFDRFGISIRRGNSRFLGGKSDACLRSLASFGKSRRRVAGKRRMSK